MISLTLSSLFNNDWITLVFFLILALLGGAKWIYKGRLFDLSVLFFTKKYLKIYGKESNPIFNGFNMILFSIQLISFSLILMVATQILRPELVDETGFYFFLKSFFGVFLFFTLRYFLGLALSILFESKSQHQRLVFAKISYMYAVVIMILPFLLLVFFVKKHNLLAFQLSMGFFGILLILRYILILKNNKTLIQLQKVNFFLYLCALEIAPLLLIVKAIVYL